MLLIISGPVGLPASGSHPSYQDTPGGLGATSWTGPYGVTGTPRYPGGPGGPGLPGAADMTATTGFPGKCTA